MEALPSATLSLHLQPFPPNPLTAATSVSNSVGNQRFLSAKALAKSPQKTHLKPPKFRTRNPKPFAERDAFPSSLPLHTRNPHAIYRDIQRFARQNKLEEALAILDYLDQQGIPVNSTTFSTLLAACVRCKSLLHGKQIHAHIRINGLENNDFLRTKLVHMYTSCDSIEDAQKVFDESTSKSVYSWNALLRGTVISGKKQYRNVLSTFLEMRELGVELNVYSFSSVIKSFAGASALRQGLKTHGILIKNGLLDSCILRTSLIDLYFKCGKIKLACMLFDEILEKDVVVWGAMIAGFAHNKRQLVALEFVRKMIGCGIYPNSAVLTMILPAIGEIKARKLGLEVHAYVLKSKNYSNQRFIHSGLVDMYCKCSDMSSGRRIFYGLTQRNAVSWTALISGYVWNGRLQQALRSVLWMQQEGFQPDVVTVATILPVCAKLRALKQGKEIHGYALKNLFLPNVSLVTSLMVMYSKCGVMGYSAKLFDNLEARNVKSWTAMIDSYAENNSLCEAIEVFRKMQVSKHRPDSVTMARMLSVCSQLKALKLGKEIHGHILKKDFESIPFVAARIIKMYGSCGAICKANLVFDAVAVKGSVTWTAIIEAYGCNEMFRDAISLFNQMVCGGFTPNDFTFMVVFSICDQAGYADEALQIHDMMLHRYKMNASEEHCCVIAGLLTRLGRVEEARRFSGKL